MKAITSVNGPVEIVNGELALRIPLVVGGKELARSARSISRVEGEYLVVVILPWLAEKLGVAEGSWVSVNNRDGTFNISVLDKDLPGGGE